MLIVVISVMLYYYIRITIYEIVVQRLTEEASMYVQNPNKFNPKKLNNFIITSSNSKQSVAYIISRPFMHKKPYFVYVDEGKETFIQLFYPIDSKTHLKLVKNTTMQSDILKQVLTDILLVNATAIALVLFYALFLSRLLLLPIKTLSYKLSSINEQFLQEIDTKNLPTEFKGLGDSINSLIGRISTFLLYQKELFVGTAHELKTPLAVMKTKNEVTLLKERESKRYIETLQANNESINSMNKMISSILEIGRQEGAQFEEPTNLDIIGFLEKLGKNFSILAHQEDKNVVLDLHPNILNIKIQSTLLTHVIQNFVQNAIKFSPPKGVIKICSRLEKDSFIIEVIDEGCGIDESKDLFAPFKRYGNKSGSGLGLFLAKGATQALGGELSIKNRSDARGTIASLKLNVKSKG
ncbi:MAG: HAMP domain-containing histidine kinase [Campylobacter sp.]|nr:HAMP domain-containing histidine kinase [Campylobacter sp.]